MNNTAKWVARIALSSVMPLLVLDAVTAPSRDSLGAVAVMAMLAIVAWRLKANRLVQGVITVIGLLTFVVILFFVVGTVTAPDRDLLYTGAAMAMLAIFSVAWHFKANRLVMGGIIAIGLLSAVIILGIPAEVYRPSPVGSPPSPVTTPTPAKGGSTIPLTRVNIPEVGYIGLPENMTVEPVERRFRESALQASGFDPSFLQRANLNLIAAPKGLEGYAGTIVATIPGNPGKYARLSAKYTLTQQGMQELDKEDKSRLEAAVKDTLIRILEWHPVRLEDVNGMRASTFSYSQQQSDSPPVLVQQHLFQNYDRVILLLTTYRLQERSIWEAALQQSIASFVITNIR